MRTQPLIITIDYNYNKDVFNCFAFSAFGDLIELFPKINGYYKKTGLKKYLCQNAFERSFSFSILPSIKNPKLTPKNKKFDLNRICSAFSPSLNKEAEQNLQGDYYE